MASVDQVGFTGGIRLRSGETPSPWTRAKVQRLRDRRFLSPLAGISREIENTIAIPSSKIDYSQVTAMRIQVRDALQQAVGRVMGQGTIIRDLQAYDISGAAAAAAGYSRLSNKTALVANTWLLNDWGYRTVPINTAVAVYGYVQLASIPLIDAIAFTQGGVITLAQFALDSLYADQYSSMAYFDPPVIWRPQQQIGVNLLASAAVATTVEPYALMGAVAEPAGATVAPDQANLV